MNLVGKLEDGTVVEDFQNYAVQVGDVEVVQGVDMAIPLMTVGELAEISVESRFAYGAQGLTNEKDNTKSIPPNAKVRSTSNSTIILSELNFNTLCRFVH